jgi:hypothetical protein
MEDGWCKPGLQGRLELVRLIEAAARPVKYRELVWLDSRAGCLAEAAQRASGAIPTRAVCWACATRRATRPAQWL